MFRGSLKNNNGLTALMIEASENHPEIIQILINKKADLNLKDNSDWTALMRAESHKDREVFDMLIKGGAKNPQEESRIPLTTTWNPQLRGSNTKPSSTITSDASFVGLGVALSLIGKFVVERVFSRTKDNGKEN